MNQFIERIAKLPDSQKALAALILYGVVYVLFHFLVYTGKVAALEEQASQKEQLVTEREEVKRKAENRERFEKEVAALNERLGLALKELPNEREVPELLRRISSLGKKIGLEFLLFQPLPEVKKNFYAEVPVKIVVQGAYHEVALFFDRVGKLNRIVNIADIKMADPRESSGRVMLTTEGKAVTYRFLDASEQPPPPTETKKKKEADSDGGE
ncbi:type 4a pilus biogenesis protein PilO [Myxococcota bacterium]|nr:type 4a pilus biogenesis protein PilO [Myxococcota bacterium]